MRKRLWIALGCFLFPSSIHSTTIVVVARNGSVYIGADSLRSDSHASGEVDAGPTVCKVQKYGTVLIAHFGTAVLRVQTEPAHKWVTIFNGDAIERKAMLQPGTLTERADRLERDFWPTYKRIILSIPKTTPKLQMGFKRMMRSIDFVLAGKGRSGFPEAIVLRFSTDFNQPHATPQKARFSIPYDRTGIVVGLAADYSLSIGNTGIETGILSYLGAASRVHPDAVGPPFTIAHVGPDGQITYDQTGACH
jgi:hypothetical protein